MRHNLCDISGAKVLFIVETPDGLGVPDIIEYRGASYVRCFNPKFDNLTHGDRGVQVANGIYKMTVPVQADLVKT